MLSRAGANATPKYKKVTSGSCVDNGMKAINDKVNCKAAAKALNLPHSDLRYATSTNRPEGCYLYRSSSLYLGTNPNNEGKGAETGTKLFPRHPICEIIGTSATP